MTEPLDLSQSVTMPVVRRAYKAKQAQPLSGGFDPRTPLVVTGEGGTMNTPFAELQARIMVANRPVLHKFMQMAKEENEKLKQRGTGVDTTLVGGRVSPITESEDDSGQRVVASFFWGYLVGLLTLLAPAGMIWWMGR